MHVVSNIMRWLKIRDLPWRVHGERVNRRRTREDSRDDGRDCDDRDDGGRVGCPGHHPPPPVLPGPTSPRGLGVPALEAGPGPRCNIK